jgi:hypothetical protein
MHPLMGLWAHSRKNPSDAGHIVNVPAAYVMTSNDTAYLLVGVLDADGDIIEIDLCDLVVANTRGLLERVDAGPAQPVVAS